MNGPPTIVRVRQPGRWEAVLEVSALFGGSAGVVRRLRAEGLPARVHRGEVVVEASTPAIG